jgi:hypothetical protein
VFDTHAPPLFASIRSFCHKGKPDRSLSVCPCLSPFSRIKSVSGFQSVLLMDWRLVVVVISGSCAAFSAAASGERVVCRKRVGCTHAQSQHDHLSAKMKVPV